MAVGFRNARRGLFGAPRDVQMPPIVPQRTPQGEYGLGFQKPDAKPGLGTRLLGEGWEDKAFAVGGLMRGDPSGAYMLQQRKDMAAQQAAQTAAEQRKRAADLADWRWKQDYQRENPGGTALQQNYEWLRETNPDAADAYLERMTSNYEYRQGPDGRFYRIDIAEQPARPVGGLKPMGGTGGNAGGGF
ncbi:hypothetical protein GRI72_02950 [Altererythrobacter marinus]|uniref:Uncharacterized protein n=1 Tax=Pelagerythrobacter marinus TaxID=538382 RepID=A0ABW9UV00_9SPHN|nr:hypothetical protein [Pelagerythrobacter marinus]MXO67791.1 hypothetical protein [Pelagerythrobacter marinus]